uniref:Uncharacterized protein n=1 Tax=Anguilla anguilla TaxID=7936 RepID=A0A0E9W5D6_ANGAN
MPIAGYYIGMQGWRKM